MTAVVKTYTGCKIYFKAGGGRTAEYELQTRQGPVTLRFAMHPSGYNGIDKEYIFFEVKSNKADHVRSTGFELKLTYTSREGQWHNPLDCGRVTNAQSNLIYLIKLCKMQEAQDNRNHVHLYLNIDCTFTWQELIVEQPTNSKSEVKQEGCKDGGLAFDQGELLKSGKLADFTIRAGNEKFPCHKLILITRSPVFEQMLSVDMVERKTGKVTITDISPENVADMLSYIYTDQVDQLDDKARELLAVSEKYCLVGLKAQCGDSLIKQISLETVADLAILADLYRLKNLRSATIRFIVKHRDQFKRNDSWMDTFQNNPAILTAVVKALL